jgi:polyisoprenoid-binding protein YceI
MASHAPPQYYDASTPGGTYMKRLLSLCAASLLFVAAPAAAADIAPVTTDVPAGVYAIDPTHASLTFRVSHMGLSRYTARFTKVRGRLSLDPENPAASQLVATIDPRSIKTDFPLPQPDFDAQLAGPDWLDADKYPEMKFTSKSIVLTSPDTAKVNGDLSLHGATRPVTLDVTFNGGVAKQPMGMPGARIGFSAQGTLKRSDFGMTKFITLPDNKPGIGDDVEFWIEAEMTNAPMGPPPGHHPPGPPPHKE